MESHPPSLLFPESTPTAAGAPLQRALAGDDVKLPAWHYGRLGASTGFSDAEKKFLATVTNGLAKLTERAAECGSAELEGRAAAWLGVTVAHERVRRRVKKLSRALTEGGGPRALYDVRRLAPSSPVEPSGRLAAAPIAARPVARFPSRPACSGLIRSAPYEVPADGDGAPVLRLFLGAAMFEDSYGWAIKTLAHELTHAVLATIDDAYGDAGCQRLILEDPCRALRNADNWASFLYSFSDLG